jgi:trigger factor
MDVSTEKLEDSKVLLTITVPRADVARAYDKAWRNLSAKLTIPGFRKGKAPRRFVEQRVGTEAVREEAFDILAAKSYAEALAAAGVEPVSRPGLDIKVMEEDKDLVFTAEVTIKPEVELGQYKGLEADKEVRAVTDADIDAALDKLRERKAQMVVVEGEKLETGDFAIIDFAGSIDGKPFSGGEGKSYPLEVGSGRFIKGLEDQLIGALPGEEREVTVSFPSDYFIKDLAGKTAEFKVKIHEIKRKRLPEATEEFIKENSAFETIEDWRKNCREQLEKAAEITARTEYEGNLVKKAVDNAAVHIPEVMVEEWIEETLGAMERNLQQRGLRMDDYLNYLGKTREEMRDSYKETAEGDIKAELVMDAIAGQESLTVEEEELRQEVQALAERCKMPVEEVQKKILNSGYIFKLRQTILRRKAARLIVAAGAGQD